MREVLANIIVISLSGGILYHFYLIITHGAITIYEINRVLSYFEIAMFCAFIALAVVNIIKLLRSN